MQASQRTMAGIGLYQLPGFSYPPLYGYWCMALGGLSRLFGIAPASLGGTFRKLPGSWQFGGAFQVSSPWFTFAAKLPFIAGTALTGYFLWRIVLTLGGNTPQNVARARLAFLFWSLSPLVVFVSSVHGQIDPIVSCALAGSVFFALENRWFLAGIAVTLGIAAKLSPVFLVPILLGLALRPDVLRWRRVGALITGGIAAAVLTMGPTFGSDFVRNVFTRTGQGGSVGGLGPFGLLSLPLLNRIWIVVDGHIALIGQVGLLGTALVSVIAGWWVWRSRQPFVVITMSLAVMMTATLATPVLNSQYLLWLYPFLAIAASGVLMERTRWFQVAALIISFTSLLQTVSLLGPSDLLVPSMSAFGWPSVGSVEHQWWILFQPHKASTFVPGLNKDRIDVLCALALTVAFVAIAASLWTTERKARSLSIGAQPASGPPKKTASALVLGAILVVEIFGLLAPSFWSAPNVTATLSSTASRNAAVVSVATRGESSIHLVGFATGRLHTLGHVYVYNDPLRPYFNSSDSNVLGTFQ